MLGHKLLITISPWTGFSGVYTKDVLDRIERSVLNTLNDKFGLVNADGHYNWETIRSEDWSSFDVEVEGE